MIDYCQVSFNDIEISKQEILVALLNEAGYEGFQQSESMLLAFIPSPKFDQAQLNELCIEQDVDHALEYIKAKNWNQSWEENFQPVIIDQFAAIRADFHSPVGEVSYDIVITPKMSFGTGHHATTYLMVTEMAKMDFENKAVLDFGTGTGILAILAKKMGAARVVAIDNDDWSIENASENFKRNQCSDIELIKQDHANVNGSYGIIVANINRNVILGNLDLFADKLEKNGNLLLSGLLTVDVVEISNHACLLGFKPISRMERNDWQMIRYTH